MKVLSVTDRELRVSARQSFTYWLRVFGVVGLLLVLILFSLDAELGPQNGGKLFSAMHGALFLGIWIFGPLLTADCISHERREGTLPLLFLTNLNPRDIVYAKGFANGLRAFSLWLAVLPLLAVPLVAGGVGWTEVVISALVNFGALCLAIGAGLLASAISRSWNRSLALAACFAAMLFVAFTTASAYFLVLFMSLFRALPRTGRPVMAGFWQEMGVTGGVALTMNWDGFWQKLLAVAGKRGWFWLIFGSVAVGSLGLLLVLIRFAAWRVRRVWREEPSSARMERLKTVLFSPLVFRSLLRRWLDWQLRRNPIGWLEQRSWSGRLIVWSWFAVVVCIYSSLFSNLSLYQRGFHFLQVLLASLLAGSIALSASGSFRRERDSGVLELLLVSPVAEWQIIGGRVRGLWMQFLPAMTLLFGVWVYCASFLSNEAEAPSVLVFAATFACLPIIGLYFSLTRASFVASLIWTLALGIAAPSAFGNLVRLWLDIPDGEISFLANVVAPALAQIVMAGWMLWRLHYRLRYRKFSWNKAAA